MARKLININGRTGPDHENAADAAYAAIRQLDAASGMIVGEGFSLFAGMHEDIQHNYLWLLKDLAERIRFATEEQLQERVVDRGPRASARCQ